MLNIFSKEKYVFLIEKGWIDPMENHIERCYIPFGYMKSEKKAKEFCESQGFWTEKDCWSIASAFQDKKMPKFKYTKLRKYGKNKSKI